MSINEDANTVVKEGEPQVATHGSNSVDVKMNDTVGAVFLGILSLILLIGWMRAETRLRDLLAGTDHKMPS